jgi:hypothetical protein
MERELWTELTNAMRRVECDFFDEPAYEHPTAEIVKLHLWSVLHDRPTYWACKSVNWSQDWVQSSKPTRLPNQSTMSRRLKSPAFKGYMDLLSARMNHVPGAMHLFRNLDAKALPVAKHSKDKQASFGRGQGGVQRGYKLHAIWDHSPMPRVWCLAPLHVSEQAMALRMLRKLDTAGVIAADKNYDSNKLFQAARHHGQNLYAPRRYGSEKSLGHRRHDPQRILSKQTLESPLNQPDGYGANLLKNRSQIERDFGNLTSFGGGLTSPPAWVRTYKRMHRWVWAKLLINAARKRIHERKSNSAA